jgi:hypothetical protein
MIADSLKAQRGLFPVGGVSITQPPQDIRALIESLNGIGRTLREQYARAREIYEAARSAAVRE